MSEHTSLTKLREWDDEPNNPDDPDEWPSPPSHIEYRVEGQMRADILARLGREASDRCEVRLIESDIEGGWSEYTVEWDYEIEVWVHEGGQAQRVYERSHWSAEDRLPDFIKWIGGEQ